MGLMKTYGYYLILHILGLTGLIAAGVFSHAAWTVVLYHHLWTVAHWHLLQPVPHTNPAD